MFEKFADWSLGVVDAIPALLVDPQSPNFLLIRAMFVLILIAALVYLIAMRPVRSALCGSIGKLSRIFSSRS